MIVQPDTMRGLSLRKAPFPWFGGKRKAAPIVWEALGDVAHYVEPFAGSLAVLLERPHECNRTYYSETVNDADGLLVNAWRSIQLRPDETAHHASNPVAEADLHARHVGILKWQAAGNVERLMGDPEFCDPKIAGWWLWGQSSWIGSGWCSGRGAWWVDDEGRLVKRAKPAREQGVTRKRPHLGNNGQGVNRPQIREPGVSRKLPNLGDNGRGVNTAHTREQGVKRQRPHLGNDGQGVNTAHTREQGVDDLDFHSVTMPVLLAWFRYLSARLRHVRILNGDWSRAVTSGATKHLSVRQGIGPCGVFLDPPYADTASRCSDLYTRDDESVAHAVRQWCLEHGADPDYRIVLAGFEGEHGTDLTDAGWREVEWFAAGFLTGGMGNVSGKHQQKRERLWLSPHCEQRSEDRQMDLFGGPE